MKRLLLLSRQPSACGCVLKEEIKAVYGYERVYSVPTVSRVDKLGTSAGENNRGAQEQRKEKVDFQKVLSHSLEQNDGEMKYTSAGYNRRGVYQEYLYLTREYRR